MLQPTETAPLVLVDCRPETEEVLRAVFEPRGVIVRRALHERHLKADPCIVIRGSATPWQASHVQVIEEPSASGDRQSDYHELRLPPLFHYGDLIRTVERLLDGRRAA